MSGESAFGTFLGSKILIADMTSFEEEKHEEMLSLRLWDTVNYGYTSNVSLKNFASIQHVITYLDKNKFLQYIYLLEN